MDEKYFSLSKEGTPQGGVISPLLANIALHGLEIAIALRWPNPKNRPKIVRYADDFVILHYKLSVITECQKLVSQWLAEIGLQIHPAFGKTRIAHTLNKHNGQEAGFNFLSANFRQYRIYKRHDKSKKGVQNDH